MIQKQQKRIARKRRYKVKLKGVAKKPRLCVFRSAKHLYCQLIDDVAQKTLFSAHDTELKNGKLKPIEQAFALGELIAKKATAQKVSIIIFDKSGYKYHGKVKAVADGARKGGLKF